MPPAPFAELIAKTSYSFLEGASHPEEMTIRARELEYAAIGVVDRQGVYGAPRAHCAAKKVGIPLLIGSDVVMENGQSAILIARNRNGYGNLCELLTEAHGNCDREKEKKIADRKII